MKDALGRCRVARLIAPIKRLDFWIWQGANRSDSGRYREDLQRGQGLKDAFSGAG